MNYRVADLLIIVWLIAITIVLCLHMRRLESKREQDIARRIRDTAMEVVGLRISSVKQLFEEKGMSCIIIPEYSRVQQLSGTIELAINSDGFGSQNDNVKKALLPFLSLPELRGSLHWRISCSGGENPGDTMKIHLTFRGNSPQ